MDGRCKTMDSSADGYVRAEGCVVFLLGSEGASKQAEPAEMGMDDGIVIRGSAVNQDGRSSSLTAPNGPSQQAALQAALLAARLSPAGMGSLEVHGTGTPLGDPIEMGAVAAVLQGSQLPVRFTAAKSRLGHAETAAGTLGMLHITTQLTQMRTNSLTHLRTVNPYVISALEGGRSAVFVPRQEGPLVLALAQQDDHCMGVSSFAFQVRKGLGRRNCCSYNAWRAKARVDCTLVSILFKPLFECCREQMPT